MADEITFAIYPLQAAVKTRLTAHDFFSDIPVFTEEKGDLDSAIETALGTLTEKGEKIGACVVILTPVAKSKSPAAPGPLLDDFLISINVLENVLVNQGDDGTKKHAIEIVELIIRYLHRWTVPGTNAALRIAANAFTITNSDPLTYQVNFITSLCLKPES
jgi:hypothetical protein